MEPKAN